MDKPLNVEENIKVSEEIKAGLSEAKCFYCKSSPCYELSCQGNYTVQTFLYDEKRLVCTGCYNFMNKTGQWLTKIIRVMLIVRTYSSRKKGK